MTLIKHLIQSHDPGNQAHANIEYPATQTVKFVVSFQSQMMVGVCGVFLIIAPVHVCGSCVGGEELSMQNFIHLSKIMI